MSSVKYIELINNINSYDKYKEELINLNDLMQYNKKLFEKIVDFNFDKFLFLLKILFFPIAVCISFIMPIGILDNIFGTDIESIFREILKNNNNIISVIVFIPAFLGIIFMTRIYVFRKEFIYIKYALYISLISCIVYEYSNHEFKYIIVTLVLLFNIFVFLKYKTLIFEFQGMPLLYNKKFIFKYKKEIKQIKCNIDYVDVRHSFYNNNSEVIRNITFLFMFIFIFLIIGSIISIYLNYLNGLSYLVILFIFYYSSLTYYIMNDIFNSIMTLKKIEEDL